MASKKSKDPAKPKQQSWYGQPCVVIASGPSLADDNYADVELLRQAGIKTIAVNDSWQVARFCDAIYAGDGPWWKHHHKEIDIPAQRYAMTRSAVNLYGCIYRGRFSKDGYNSGANALELAANGYRANPVIMMGFDCSLRHGVHHHGEHIKTRNPTAEVVQKWRPHFKALLKAAPGTHFINCSRYSELDYFPRQDLKQTLCELGLICATPTTKGRRSSKAA